MSTPKLTRSREAMNFIQALRKKGRVVRKEDETLVGSRRKSHLKLHRYSTVEKQIAEVIRKSDAQS